jgi:molecular chaperone GrpE
VIRDNRKIKVAENEPVTPAESTRVETPETPVAPDQDEAQPAATVAEEAPETGTEPAEAPPAGPLGAELEALRGELDERTNDLQRVTAEYANYRKRVERDRSLVVEQATGAVLAALLPVLDDLDRARDHGDLVGPFASVAEQLTNTLAKFGLTAFGAKGDRFDPTRHEAVSHSTSADVTEPTCVDVMRRGYLLGERLLRPALVGVADPE